MITTFLTIAATLALVLTRVLIPATVHAVHAIVHWRPALPSIAYPRRIAAGRLAVPAAA